MLQTYLWGDNPDCALKWCINVVLAPFVLEVCSFEKVIIWNPLDTKMQQYILSSFFMIKTLMALTVLGPFGILIVKKTGNVLLAII